MGNGGPPAKPPAPTGTASLQQPSGGNPVTVTHAPRNLLMRSVTDEELDAIAGIGPGIHFGIFGISITSLIAFVTTLLTVTLSDRTFAVHVGLAVVAFLATCYFGYRSVSEYREIGRRLRRIRGGGP